MTHKIAVTLCSDVFCFFDMFPSDAVELPTFAALYLFKLHWSMPALMRAKHIHRTHRAHYQHHRLRHCQTIISWATTILHQLPPPKAVMNVNSFVEHNQKHYSQWCWLLRWRWCLYAYIEVDSLSTHLSSNMWSGELNVHTTLLTFVCIYMSIFNGTAAIVPERNGGISPLVFPCNLSHLLASEWTRRPAR